MYARQSIWIPSNAKLILALFRHALYRLPRHPSPQLYSSFLLIATCSFLCTSCTFQPFSRQCSRLCNREGTTTQRCWRRCGSWKCSSASGSPEKTSPCGAVWESRDGDEGIPLPPRMWGLAGLPCPVTAKSSLFLAPGSVLKSDGECHLLGDLLKLSHGFKIKIIVTGICMSKNAARD